MHTNHAVSAAPPAMVSAFHIITPAQKPYRVARRRKKKEMQKPRTIAGTTNHGPEAGDKTCSRNETYLSLRLCNMLSTTTIHSETHNVIPHCFFFFLSAHTRPVLNKATLLNRSAV